MTPRKASMAEALKPPEIRPPTMWEARTASGIRSQSPALAKAPHRNDAGQKQQGDFEMRAFNIRLITTALVVMAAMTGAAVARTNDGLYRWIDIVNVGDQPIWHVQITDVGDRGYGRDLLGDDIILVGDSVRVEPDRDRGYCKFDALFTLFTFADGTEVMLWDVNLCEATKIFVDENVSPIVA
jgi:hypothetical protein